MFDNADDYGNGDDNEGQNNVSTSRDGSQQPQQPLAQKPHCTNRGRANRGRGQGRCGRFCDQSALSYITPSRNTTELYHQRTKGDCNTVFNQVIWFSQHRNIAQICSKLGLVVELSVKRWAVEELIEYKYIKRQKT